LQQCDGETGSVYRKILNNGLIFLFNAIPSEKAAPEISFAFNFMILQASPQNRFSSPNSSPFLPSRSERFSFEASQPASVIDRDSLPF